MENNKMQLPESLFNDLFLESHHPLAMQSIKSLYGIDKFIIDEDRYLYSFNSYLNEVAHGMGRSSDWKLVIDTDDNNLITYMSKIISETIQHPNKRYSLYIDSICFEFWAVSKYNIIEGNIINIETMKHPRLIYNQ